MKKMEERRWKMATTLAMLVFSVMTGRADLTVLVTPGYRFSANERPTVDTLNLLGTPTVFVSGTLGGTNIAIGANSITGPMLSGTVVDGVTLDFNGSSPRAIEVMNGGIGVNQLNANVLGATLQGGSGAIVNVKFDNATIKTNASGQLMAVAANLVTYTNFPTTTNGFVGAGTNGVTTNIVFSSQFNVTGNVLGLATFTTTNINLPAANSFNLVIAHGLGATPVFVRWVLVCTTAELGYSIGDEVELTSTKDGAIDGPHFTVGGNATNVFLQARSQDNIQVYVFGVGNQGTITLANWKLKCYARL